MESYPFYDVINYISKRPKLVRLLRVLNLCIVSISIGSYVLILLLVLLFPFLFSIERIEAVKIVLPIPVIGFVGLSVFRKILNSPRPYEVYGFAPVLNKKTVGKSFPSRHLFSIYMVSMVYLILAIRIPEFSYIPAIILFVLGDILGVIRMITGVHFPRDVIVGALVGILLGLGILMI